LEVARYVRTQNVDIDETPWREGKNKGYLWGVVAPLASLFHIACSRSQQIPQDLLGKTYAGVATCDRLKSYWWIKRLQWCWAHLRRDFQAMIDRGRPGRAIGASLLAQSDTLFHLWHQLRDGKLTRQRLQQAMRPVRAGVHRALRRGQRSRCRKTAGTCQELLSHEEWLWYMVTEVRPNGGRESGSGRPRPVPRPTGREALPPQTARRRRPLAQVAAYPVGISAGSARPPGASPGAAAPPGHPSRGIASGWGIRHSSSARSRNRLPC